MYKLNRERPYEDYSFLYEDPKELQLIIGYLKFINHPTRINTSPAWIISGRLVDAPFKFRLALIPEEHIAFKLAIEELNGPDKT